MKRLYWQNTYLMRHTAEITAKGQDEYGSWIRLDATIFHPQGGGQPSDEGTINGVKVIKLVNLRDLDEINHYVEDISALHMSDFVELAIDEEKRLENAALHTAGHITGGVLRTKYNCDEQLSANHFPNQSRVEFKLKSNTLKKESLENEVNIIIADAREVCEKYNADGIRCIAINGLWSEPCSGTHVSDTSQIVEYHVRKLETKKQRIIIGYNAQYGKSKNFPC